MKSAKPVSGKPRGSFGRGSFILALSFISQLAQAAAKKALRRMKTSPKKMSRSQFQWQCGTSTIAIQNGVRAKSWRGMA